MTDQAFDSAVDSISDMRYRGGDHADAKYEPIYNRNGELISQPMPEQAEGAPSYKEAEARQWMSAMSKGHWKTYKGPALVGAYAVAGTYLARYMRGSTDMLPWNMIAMVAGSAAVAAWAAPMVAEKVISEKSSIAPYAEAAASAAVAWPLIYASSGYDANAATMFIPIQFFSYVVGGVAERKWKSYTTPLNVNALPGRTDSP